MLVEGVVVTVSSGWGLPTYILVRAHDFQLYAVDVPTNMIVEVGDHVVFHHRNPVTGRGCVVEVTLRHKRPQ